MSSTRTAKQEPHVLPNGDASQAQALLLWARANRIVVTEITVGSVHMQVNDLGLAESLVPPKSALTDEDGRRNLYEVYGGKALEDLEKAADGSTTEEEDD